MTFNIKIFLIIFLGVFQFFLFFYVFFGFLDNLINLPFDEYSQKHIQFKVLQGETASDIAKKLKNERLIKSEFLFNYYLKKIDKENELKSGNYLFSQDMSISEIADKIIMGDVYIELIKVFIPEGYTVFDISKVVSEKNIPGKNIEKFKIKDVKAFYDFLNEVDDNASLEGFLFPDTYTFNKKKVSTDMVVRRMLDNFDKKLSKKIREDIKYQKKSIFEIITMASILEKEVKTTQDMKIVSGILWKRIENGMPLQVDATTLYEYDNLKNLSKNLKISSSYNTYLNKGLPKGPISNPGIRAIEASVYPKSSDYWFYLSKKTGETVFSRTFQEHKKAIEKYLR